MRFIFYILVFLLLSIFFEQSINLVSAKENTNQINQTKKVKTCNKTPICPSPCTGFNPSNCKCLPKKCKRKVCNPFKAMCDFGCTAYDAKKCKCVPDGCGSAPF